MRRPLLRYLPSESASQNVSLAAQVTPDVGWFVKEKEVYPGPAARPAPTASTTTGRQTAKAWTALPLGARAELVAAVEDVGEAVVLGLERGGLVVEEHAPGRYRCVPLPRP